MHDVDRLNKIYLPIALVWALWPMATFAGGKLFAPLLFVLGVWLGWRHFAKRPRIDVLAVGLFLAWVYLSTLWSPAQMSIVSGSLLDGSFAIESVQVRFALSAVGVCLFLAVIAALAPERLRQLPLIVVGAVLVQLGILIWLGAQRESLILANGVGLFEPSPQSLGRNANLLAMAVPLLAGILLDRMTGRYRYVLILSIFILGGWSILKHDALAGLLGWGIGCGFGLILMLASQGGFRLIFNLIAAGIVATPLLVKTLLTVAPPSAVSLPLSAEQRLVIWQAALEKISLKPMFGHGVNSVSLWDETYAARPDLLSQLDPVLANARVIPNHTHNMPLQIWAETGLVGAALLGLVFVLLGRVMPSPQSMSLGTKVAAAGVLGTAVALFMVAYSAWDESYWASLAVTACALIALAKQKPVATL